MVIKVKEGLQFFVQNVVNHFIRRSQNNEKEKNILGLSLVLTLVGITIFLDNTFHNNDNYLTLYIISKSAAVLLLIVGFIYSMFFKKS